LIWRIQTLGGLTVTRGSQVITRFESSRVAALLAYLALFSKHPASREELIELLWPEEETDRGKQRLRQAIYSLRRQLEPPGIPPNTVLNADRYSVGLNPQSFSCDAIDFNKLVREKQFVAAKSVYTGELLPGFYDEWILDERNRLQAIFENLPETAHTPDETVKAAPAGNAPFVSLPGYLTEYFGRVEERCRILEQLASRRLVTITGLGGIGKTRIAIEVAREASSRYDRTALVPLEECVSPGQILEHIPPALQLPRSQSSPMDQMVHALAGSKVLLVLDNLEQLAGVEGASHIEEMLTRFPGMTCLVTSRRLLGIQGECEIPLSPLPTALSIATLEETARSPGVALFISRAQAGRPGFQITENNRDDVVTLCNALDGLPLALEIAASRIRAFTPSEMLAQLEDRFRLLARPIRGAHKDQRHRSIEATLEWSWRLLTPDQQQFLSALSVFRGGWTADFAAEVCEAADAGERLEELAMDSLVISEETRERTTRFRLLEVVRVFVREKLEEEQARGLVRRHRAAYLDLARRVQGGKRVALFAEGENLKAALESAISAQEVNTALALCVAVGDNWLPLVGPDRAMELMQETLGLPFPDPGLRVEGLSLASHLSLLTQNRSLACAMASEALDVAGDTPHLRARSLIASARAQMVHTRESSLLSRSLLEEALPLIESNGNPGMLGEAQRLLGVLATRLGEYTNAERLLNSALESFERVSDRRGAVYTWDNLGGIAVQTGELDRALELYGESQRRAEEINEVVYSAKVLQNLATIYARQKRWERALAVGQECIRRNQALGNAYILAYALWNLTEPLTHLQRYGEAARLMAFIERFWVEQYDPLNEDETGYCAMIYAQVEAALGEVKAAEHRKAGARMTLVEAIRLALLDLPV
jgi:predicted ATPase